MPPPLFRGTLRPDGTVYLGACGSVNVAGLTVEQARAAVAKQLAPFAKKKAKLDVKLGVAASNSKSYYVISDGGGGGEQVVRVAWTGNEAVLDALNLVPGLADGKWKVWVARRTPNGGEQVLPVDWKGITQDGLTATNYQVMTGDRVYVRGPAVK